MPLAAGRVELNLKQDFTPMTPITTFSQTLQAHCKRGSARGEPMRPHRYADGSYVASPTRFKKDYVQVVTIEELTELCRRGFNVRMSAELNGRRLAPSLVAPSAIAVVAC